jgi:2-hydroxychromene-2-carboxylate isomerase
VLLGGIFKLTNNKPPMEAFMGITNKNEYQGLEIRRFIERYRLNKFEMNPHFPVITLQIMRGAIAADIDGYLSEYVEKVMTHMWEESKKMDDPEVISSALKESGLDADRFVSQVQEPNIKTKLISNTEKAVQRGAFGIPTFFIGDEMYFGKDTLWQIEEALSK